MPPQQNILRWSAYEHDFIERGADWFWALGIIALCGAVLSVLFGDTLFGVLIIVAAVAFGLMANVPSELATFELSERGIRINGILHRYHDVVSFWVEDEHHRGHPLLLIDTTKFMAPNFIIPIVDIDPHVVRTYLQKRAKEKPMREPL